MEQQLPEKLRAELDAPAPAVQTSLSDIMRRGLRRRRLRQTGSAAVSLAVVAGVGVLAMTLGGKDTRLNQPAEPTGVATTTAGVWPQANLPEHVPYGTWTPASTAPPPPGFPQVAIPLCDSDTGGWLDFPEAKVPAAFGEQVVAKLRAAAPKSSIGVLTPDMPPKASRSYGLRVDIRDPAGVGSLWIRAGSFTDTPLTQANRQAYAEGNCRPPQRTLLQDGTVLQIYPYRAMEPYQTLTQTLVIYRPDGRLYSISQWSDGSVDVRPDPKQPSMWERIGKGRGTLPLTEQQLAAVGIGVAGS
ncbi:hypothetical protein [Actinocrispum sp. NPDC049592]|uniref:hypothetical protein n=1 Tax=Actinocrispum sp. NPDC049592 TaxID=3154835 RepID=UPI00341AA6E1